MAGLGIEDTGRPVVETGGTWAAARNPLAVTSPLRSSGSATPKMYSCTYCLYITHHKDTTVQKTATANIVKKANVIILTPRESAIEMSELEEIIRQATRDWEPETNKVIFLELNIGKPGEGLKISPGLIDWLANESNFPNTYIRLFSAGTSLGREIGQIDVTPLGLERFANRVSAVGKGTPLTYNIPAKFLAVRSTSRSESVGASGAPSISSPLGFKSLGTGPLRSGGVREDGPGPQVDVTAAAPVAALVAAPAPASGNSNTAQLEEAKHKAAADAETRSGDSSTDLNMGRVNNSGAAIPIERLATNEGAESNPLSQTWGHRIGAFFSHYCCCTRSQGRYDPHVRQDPDAVIGINS